MSTPRVVYQSDPRGVDDDRFVVMEYGPMRVPASLRGDDEMFSLWVPWLVSLVRIASGAMSLWARPRTLTPHDQELFHLGWPHIANTGAVCYHPWEYINEYRLAGETVGECDVEVAIACMQIFLNGNSSYFICSPDRIPTELRPTVGPPLPGMFWERRVADDNTADSRIGNVKDYFRRWERLRAEEILALHYTPVTTLTDAIADAHSYRFAFMKPPVAKEQP